MTTLNTAAIDPAQHRQPTLSFVDVFDSAKPALLLLFQYSDWKTVCRLAKTCKALHIATREDYRPEYGKPFGDELLIQRLILDSKKQQIVWQQFGNDSTFFKHSASRNPKPTRGPMGSIDAIQVSKIGQAIRLDRSIKLGEEWTICVWTYIECGRPLRPGFDPTNCNDGGNTGYWYNGAGVDEYALVGSTRDDQQIFCRGSYLGCFACDAPVYTVLNNKDKDGFFSTGFSFENVPNGWHHIAATGTMKENQQSDRKDDDDDVALSKVSTSIRDERCSGGTRMSAAYGTTCYYIDGDPVGMVPYNLQTPISYIGNVSEEEYGLQAQQWGVIADLRIFRRVLTHSELKLLCADFREHKRGIN